MIIKILYLPLIRYYNNFIRVIKNYFDKVKKYILNNLKKYNMSRKLANFDNSKWTYEDLKGYAKKYRNLLKKKSNVPHEILNALKMYQSQSKELLIANLKTVQCYLYK